MNHHDRYRHRENQSLTCVFSYRFDDLTSLASREYFEPIREGKNFVYVFSLKLYFDKSEVDQYRVMSNYFYLPLLTEPFVFI
jgi:hypothetical protein